MAMPSQPRLHFTRTEQGRWYIVADVTQRGGLCVLLLLDPSNGQKKECALNSYRVSVQGSERNVLV